MAKVSLKHPTRAETVDVEWRRADSDTGDMLHFEIDGERTDVRVERGANGGLILRIDGRVVPAYHLRDGNTIHVWIGGRVHTFELAGGVQRAGGSDAAALVGDLSAPMPGTVLDIKVEAGDTFEAHQPLVIMESMKMEMTLSAPGAGRVEEVVCQTGALVEMGALLLKLEAEDVA